MTYASRGSPEPSDTAVSPVAAMCRRIFLYKPSALSHAVLARKKMEAYAARHAYNDNFGVLIGFSYGGVDKTIQSAKSLLS